MPTENVRFYLEATIIVHGEVILPICCFPPFSQLSAFAYIYFYLTCSFLLACRLSPKWDHLCPRYLEMIFSREWDHLCPRYLGVMFHPSGTICAQNVRFYIEATLTECAWRDYFASLLFSPVFSIVCFCLYIFLFDLFFFACLSVFTQVGPSVPKVLRSDFSPKWVHLSRRYLTVIFFFRGDFLTKVRVPPFVPGATCARNFNRGHFLRTVALDHLFPKHTILPENNFYRGEVICQLVVVLPCFSFVCFCLYIFLFNLSFFACMSLLLVFFFRCVPVREAVRILCRIPESSAAMA